METLAIAIGGFSTALLVGGVATYQRRLKVNKLINAIDFNSKQDQTHLMNVIKSLKLKDGPQLCLYRYTTCPFCGKVSSFLNYHGIAHKNIEVEPMLKKELSGVDYKKVPQLKLSYKSQESMLVDSSLIVDTLAKSLGHENEINDADVSKWRRWANESLVRHIVLNINSTLLEAWRGYSYIDAFDTIPAHNKLFLKTIGAPVMFVVSRYMTLPKLIKAGEIKRGGDVRDALYKQVDYFITEGLKSRSEAAPFHGGARPNLADLDIYGIFQSIRNHKVYNNLLKHTKISPWMNAMDSITKV